MHEGINQLSMYAKWERDSTLKESADLWKDILELQLVKRKNTVLSYIRNENLRNQNVIHLDPWKISEHSSKPLMNVVSTNISEIMAQWILDLASKPKELAAAILNIYQKPCQELRMFASLTFPSLFFHFVTTEWQKLALTFLKKLLELSSDPDFFDDFIVSFIDDGNVFTYSLWTCFRDYMARCRGAATVDVVFKCLMKALKTSLLVLSTAQYDILRIYGKHHNEHFGKFISSLLLNSYAVFSCEFDTSREKEVVTTVLRYIENTESPQLKYVIDTIKRTKTHRWISHHMMENKTPIVLSCHECLVIQKIAKECPKMVKVNYMENLAVGDEYLHSYDPVYVTISVVSVFRSYSNENIKLSLNNEHEWSPEEIDEVEYADQCKMWKDLERVGIKPSELLNSESYVARDTQSRLPATKSPKFIEYVSRRVYNTYLKQANQFELFMNQLCYHRFVGEEIARANCTLSREMRAFAVTVLGESLLVVRKPSSKGESDFIASSLAASPRTVQRVGSSIALSKAFLGGDQAKEMLRRRQSFSEAARILDDNVSDSPRVKKHRRRSAESDQSQQVSTFRTGLNSVLSSVPDKSRFRFWVFLMALNNVVPGDKSVAPLSKKYHELMKCRRFDNELRNMSRKEKVLARKLGELKHLKKGSAIIVILEFVNAIIRLVGDDNERSSVFENCLLLANNDLFYEDFIWCENLETNFPEFKTSLPPNYSAAMEFLTRMFWNFLENLDPEFCRKSKQQPSL